MTILDTSACIDFLNGNKDIRKKINDLEDIINITSITIYEINIGLNRTRREISEKRYNNLNKIWLEFISGMEIYSLNIKEAEKAAEIYDYLLSKGNIIDDNEILIIGIMLTHNIKKIITKNIDHFKRIEKIEPISY